MSYNKFPPSPVVRLPLSDKFMMAENKEITVEKVREASPPSSEDTEKAKPVPETDPHWIPGFWVRFPWLGLGSLIVVLICGIGSVLTLILSDGKSQTKWPKRIAPNVILSVMNNVANICFGVAIGNGIAIAWWRQALKGNTIKRLHRSWSFSTSFLEVALAGKYFNIVALAALTAKLTMIDGVLMQKAFSTQISQDPAVHANNILGFANKTIPITGRITNRGLMDAGLLSRYFNDDLKIWQQSGGLLPPQFTGCDGLCFLDVPAAGFEFDCEAPIAVDIDYGVTAMNASNVLSGPARSNLTQAQTDELAKQSSPAIFNLAFEVINSNLDDIRSGSVSADKHQGSSYIAMDLLYTQAQDRGDTCPGNMTKQTCRLWPAVISYPVQLDSHNTDNSMNGIKLGVSRAAYFGESGVTSGAFNRTLKQQNGYEILRYTNVQEEPAAVGSPLDTRLGGIQLGLQMYLGGSASVSHGGAFGWRIAQQYNAPQYLTNAPESSSCAYQYLNPLVPGDLSSVPSVVENINQIMFVLATDMSAGDPANDLNTGSSYYNATVYKDSVHYVTGRAYMWGAFASTVVCILLVLPVYWGFWQLGRKVTLGPFETAAAFRSPLVNSHGTMDEILAEHGQNQLQYGHIVRGDAAGRLGFAEPEFMARAQPRLGSEK